MVYNNKVSRVGSFYIKTTERENLLFSSFLDYIYTI